MRWYDLYTGIWEQAIKDEFRYVTGQAYFHGWSSAYDVYLSKVEEPLDKNDKKFKKIKEDIKDFVDLKAEPLKNRIRMLVYVETTKWPDNPKILKGDKEYKELFKGLKNDTADFAIERMAKRWNKL